MNDLSRRKFMNIAGVSFLAALVAPVLAFFYPKDLESVPSEPVPVGPPEELPVGSSKVIPFGRYPALVLNTKEGLRAYSAVCTHFACLVKYDVENDEIVCPCHEGYFNPLDGSVKSGPPPRALEAFSVYIDEDGQIYVSAATEEAS